MSNGDGKISAQQAALLLEPAEGLELQLVAYEPALVNPTNIDVDARGRIWVTEAYNYRPQDNGNVQRPEGDRILVLEDKDSDGTFESSTVFYQGPELNAPLGICVLGNSVIVSQSPYIWRFYDDDGDDKADRKEILFQGIGGEQHDHGAHAFVFGPDGKLYFNFGNSGKTLKDKYGNPVKDQDGEEIKSPKYKQGMVFRCNPDGSAVECLGYNFRNNYELAVDSYGNIWQSDNDDDGNKAVRINYVMDYGNFGYTDELTGAWWSADRTNIEDSIPLRHWHQNDPGVVPNLLLTGSGSPTGMVVYEGGLLPEPFQNQIIHCEPGHNSVRAYPVVKNGAGFNATILPLINGSRDQWFRPSDICVAPDGSLIVSDWYDPGVGGHQAGDQQRGRIYRLAPKSKPYQVPEFTLDNADGAVQALLSPNLATRYLAWNALQQMGEKASVALQKLWMSDSHPRKKARALWLLAQLPSGKAHLSEALTSPVPELRICAIRAARQLFPNDIPSLLAPMVKDPDPQVRSECALAIRYCPDPEAADLWTTLAMQHDGNDRWYLEALGIGADGRWERFMTTYLNRLSADPTATPGGRDIIWRSRSPQSLPILAKLAMDATQPLVSRLRYFRAFDFHTGPGKTPVLLRMLAGFSNRPLSVNTLILKHLPTETTQQSPIARKALAEVLLATYGTPVHVQLTQQYQVKQQIPQLLKTILEFPTQPHAVHAVELLLVWDQEDLLLEKILADDTAASRILGTLRFTELEKGITLMQNILISENYPSYVRNLAALHIGHTYWGGERALNLIRSKQISQPYLDTLVNSFKTSLHTDRFETASRLTSGRPEKDPEFTKLDHNEIFKQQGNIAKGSILFKNYCSVCHIVDGQGKDFGPNLSGIGSKLSKEALLDAIVNPSAGVSFGYETSEVRLKNGTTITGILRNRTDNLVEIKFPGGGKQTILSTEIQEILQIPGSSMPKLQDYLSPQEMADLLSYLEQLKN